LKAHFAGPMNRWKEKMHGIDNLGKQARTNRDVRT
jgi:hypothetical protein